MTKTVWTCWVCGELITDTIDSYACEYRADGRPLDNSRHDCMFRVHVRCYTEDDLYCDGRGTHWLCPEHLELEFL